MIAIVGPIPKKATEGASGFDLQAVEAVEIPPGGIVLVDTGIRLAIPAGLEGQVRSRSGLARRGVVVANSPGTIDSDYRGSIGVILLNVGKEPYQVNVGDRIAQLVFARVEYVQFEAVEALEDTARGSGGFGSTGVGG
jgi:dUTP pyrophosphatase